MSTQELRSGVEHRSGGLRSGAAWRIRASEQRIVQRSIGALERRVAQRSGMEHRSGRAAALDGVEHRSGGLRSGEERSIGAEGCAAERSGASEDRSRVLPRTEWSIGAEGCAVERSIGAEGCGAERSIGAEGCAAERSGASEHRSGRDGVEQIRGRIGASECRISAVERSGAEWSKQN
jgi:hypothetical protein